MIPTPVEFDAPSFEINRMLGRSASWPAALYYLLNFPYRFLLDAGRREKADRPDSSRKMERQLPLNDVPIQVEPGFPCLPLGVARSSSSSSILRTWEKGEKFRPFPPFGISGSMGDYRRYREGVLTWDRQVVRSTRILSGPSSRRRGRIRARERLLRRGEV